MCTGRVDLAFVVRAFAQGADGVIIGGCWPGECHYVTEGNYDALANVHLARKLMGHIGLNPERLRLEWIAASEGSRFAEVMSDFAGMLRDLGPVGRDEGLDETDVATRLEAVARLVPFVKLVEREKLRAPEKNEETYNEFYASDETKRVFDELIADRITVTRILLALEERPLSTGEISEALGLSPSEVSKHMMTSSRQGFVRFDLDDKRYALA